MSFKAIVQPLGMPISNATKSSFFTSFDNQRTLQKNLMQAMKSERGNEFSGVDKGKCVANFNIARNNFLADIQKYAVSLDKGNIDSIYKGTEQTRFNHLVEIHSNAGVYIPTFFFFPLRVNITSNVLPLFVGSLVKLLSELEQINLKLEANKNVKIGDLPNIYEATDENLEDYEANHEGVPNFWACYDYLILERLVRESLQNKMALFIYE